MPVSLTENATTSSARLSAWIAGLQPRRPRSTSRRDAALLGELEGVGEQVLEHLLQPLRVGDDRRAAGRGRARRRTRAPCARPRGGSCARRSPRSSAKATSPDVDRHRARLDLGQVEDVVDQREQVGAGGVDGLGELDLLGGEVALGVLGEQLGEDQQAVERRAQLVATCWPGTRTCTSRSARAARPSPRAPAGPARSRGSCARPRRSARRAGGPSPPAPRWSAAALPAAP